tara:strand:- start:854 stop:1084 length:231 start_codon:yes stop_codon:yes gene_type:complete
MSDDFTLEDYAIMLYGNRLKKKDKPSSDIEDKSFSIKDEGHLNPNNIIFKDKKYKELVDSLKPYDKSLKEKRNGKD